MRKLFIGSLCCVAVLLTGQSSGRKQTPLDL
jgi:hypothetical protein